MLEGSATLSFDCEGKWGMTDIHTPWDVNLTRSALLSAYHFILRTLEKYDIPATFAFVGAFTETREEFLQVSYPKLSSSSYTNWLSFSRDRILDKSEEGWFLPELLDMVIGQKKHEIASHGYTHIPFSTLTEPDVRLELSMVQRWAEKKHIDCSTLIFPRNMVYHKEILKDYAILGYRDVPISLLGARTPRFLRTLAEETWIFQKSESFKKGEPGRIPGGSFINWQSGFRRAIPAHMSLLKYRNMISSAVKLGGVAHFWLHPHNLITSPHTKKLFSELCAQIAYYRDSTPLVVKRQKDYLSLVPKSNSIAT